MPPALPQELIDQIVDDVQANPHTSQQRAETLALLRAARCFGARCRKHLYHAVDLALEVASPTVINNNKSFDVKSLRFMELVRRTPSLADLVKHIHYSLHFQVNDASYIKSTRAWRMLRNLAPCLTHVDMVTLKFYDSRHMSDSKSLFRMTLDSQLLEAIGVIIPSCPFSRLRIEQTSLLPIDLVGFLAHCPHVTSLEIREVSALHDPLGGNGTLQSQIPAVPPKIEELIFHKTNAFIVEMLKHDACRTLVASTRRLVFNAHFEGWTRTEDMWDIIGDFMSQLGTLEKVFFHLSGRNPFAMSSDVRTLVHAPSLCLEMSSGASLPDLSSAFRQNPSYPSKLQNLAMVVHAYRSPSIAHWRELASVLHQPRFAALETVCITFAESPWEKHPPLVEEEVSRCFAKFGAKVTVKKLDISGWPQVYTYFDTFF